MFLFKHFGYSFESGFDSKQDMNQHAKLHIIIILAKSGVGKMEKLGNIHCCSLPLTYLRIWS